MVQAILKSLTYALPHLKWVLQVLPSLLQSIFTSTKHLYKGKDWNAVAEVV